MTKKAEMLHSKLADIVGPDRVKVDKMERLMYSHDLAPLPKQMELGVKMLPDAVARPTSAEEVSRIIKLACELNVPVVPRGAASWGYGGAVPAEGGIVLDLTSMADVLRVDTDNMEVEVEAGATWRKVMDAAKEKGLLIGSWPSSAPSATIAGWINTGGIGVGTYKYGSVGAYIRNMEVVLPEGQIINTGFDGVSDHSAGFNLNGLFVGSEGTLGVITKVTLKAYPYPEVIKPVSIAFNDLEGMYPLLKALTRSAITPMHISFADQHHGAYLKRMGKPTHGEGAVLNITLDGSKETVAWEEAVMDALVAEHGAKRLSDEVARHEWEENPYEFRVREVGVSAGLGEAVVPLPAFPEALKDVYGLIDSMKMEAAVLGMVGDRNTVLLMPYYLYDEKKLIKSMTTLAFLKKLGDIAIKHKGRPLGLGLFFAVNLRRIRGDDEARMMEDMKTVLDPHDILNPGKLTEGLTRYGAPIPGFAMNMGMNVMAAGKKVLSKDKAFDERASEHVPRHGPGPAPEKEEPEE